MNRKFRYTAKRTSRITAIPRESLIMLCSQLELALHWVPKRAAGITRDADATYIIEDAVDAKVVLIIDSLCLIPAIRKQNPTTLLIGVNYIFQMLKMP